METDCLIETGAPIGIPPSDMAGVALAAIKALQEENAELRERMAALEEKLAGPN